MSFDPYSPYGPVVDTTLRAVIWNVWGRFGEWEQRQRALEDELVVARPDVVALVETSAQGDESRPARLAERLGFQHSVFAGDFAIEDWTSGLGVVSRWPILEHERHPLRGDSGNALGEALRVRVDGPRGVVQLFVVALDYPLSASGVRQAQVRELCTVIAQTTSARHVTLVCGDFNAGPDADEMRMLTGRSAPPVDGLVFYDAWEIAGDGSAGITWSNGNPLARVGHYPDRRFDYILSAWPRLGAAGHPVHCERLGVRDISDAQVSDHYGVLADIRY
jgi:endonuclease/exonuclease/phosphatase family metal-dependent hydrolase